MANCMGFHTQIASIVEVLSNAFVAEICKLVDDDYAVFRLEITQSHKENRTLRRKLQLLELKVARDRVLASHPSSVKILDRYSVTARGEGHLTGGNRSVVKPVGHNTWRDDQPITVNEGSRTSPQHIIMIESADAESAGPGVKQERRGGEEDPRHSRDIETGVPPVAMEDHTTAPAQPRTCHSIMEVNGMLNAVLKSETDRETLTVKQRILHTERLGCSPAPGSEYLLHGNPSSRTVHSHPNPSQPIETGNDPSCSYATEMDTGNMLFGLETQTDLSKGDRNQYSGSVYSEGCLDKKGEVIVVDEVIVKLEGDAPPTWNADSHLGDEYSQGRDFLNYRDSLETNANVVTHSPLHALKDHDPVSTSMGPSDSHGHVFFDQVLNSNDMARDQARRGGATLGGSKEKRFLCMFCNKGFSSPQKVEIHQRVHTGEKPYSCTHCHMRFTEAGTLKRHQRVHTGEKPYNCPQCEKRFSRQDHLKMHLKVHTGERPFACTQCGKRFSERSYLRMHQQKNHSTR
ncbi:zinc finger protein with KRAB and SCAN domains 1-like isoform X1 [Oncorhynchus kisutch]|uniref:zinc finger protein with KRAB and SCAN domains 1-like isoform X1 n=1 Tax=Oncorhynchus kisutch TaxID=8019 RepID=UPI00099F5D0C|nr:zinc finger protein with KRAB and SCAN domains 1-like isoform X1 [Oncorhynchus kisutch]